VAEVEAAWDYASSQVVTIIAADWGHLLESFLQFTPTIDGELLTAEPLQSLAAGDFPANVAVLLGTNSNEGTTFIFGGLPQPLPGALYDLALDVVFGGNASRIVDFGPQYAAGFTNDSRQALSNLLTDYWFRCPSQHFALGATQAGAQAWVYRYNHVFSNRSLFVKFGFPAQCAEQVCHAVELPFVFHNTPDPSVLNVTFSPAEAQVRWFRERRRSSRSGSTTTGRALSRRATQTRSAARQSSGPRGTHRRVPTSCSTRRSRCARKHAHASGRGKRHDALRLLGLGRIHALTHAGVLAMKTHRVWGDSVGYTH
jgi:carboxylesterase type B